MRRFGSAARAATLAAVGAALCGAPAPAQFAVIDVANIQQTTISALQQVAAVQKQIEQYTTQLQQYENMLQNTAAPVANVWQRAQQTMDGLQQSTNSLNFFSRQAGGIDQYLEKFKNPSYYASSPCFTAAGCSPQQRAMIQADQRAKQAMAMATNDSVLRGIQTQQANLNGESQRLDQLQASAQGATGQMQALGYANQLAASSSNQLMQIRSLLMSQQAASLALQQTQQDKDALADAATAAGMQGTFQPSGAGSYKFSAPR